MIVLYTDFGAQGPYMGQLHAVLKTHAPSQEIVHLQSDAPGDPRLSSYLLAALRKSFPALSVFLAIVDPGVGGRRLPIVLKADNQWFVGPDNGLFNSVAVQSRQPEWSIIEWRPAVLSASFHGRDLFAPIAARLAASGCRDQIRPYQGPDLKDWAADCNEIIYIDYYGNAMSGLRYSKDLKGKILIVNGTRIHYAETFCAASQYEAFWYGNSSGLVEIAVNQGRASVALGLQLGMSFCFQDSEI